MIMQSMWGVIILIVTVALSIYLGEKLKVNSGFIAMMFALVIGVGLGGMTASSVSGLFKGTFFVNVLLVTAFFGYPLSNGTMTVLASKLVHRFHGAAKALPFILCLISVIVSAMGGGSEGGSMFMSTIAFSLGLSMGYQPVILSGLVFLGCYIGGMVPWLSSFSICMGVFESFFDYTTSNALVMGFFLSTIPMTIIMMILMYFFTGAHKVDVTAMETEVPPAFTPDQKKSLGVMFVVIILVIAPTFLSLFLSGPVISWLTRFVTIRLVAAVGIVVCCFMKLGDSKDVFTKRIPWGMLITVSGMMLLISTVVQCGTVDYISELLTNAQLSHNTVLIIFFVVGFALSFVSTGPGTVFPLTSPLSIALGPVLGLEPYRMVMAAIIGSMATAFSPFSTGGALALSACPDEIRGKAVRQQLLWTGIEIVVCFVIQIAGIGDFLCRLFL